MRARFLHRLAWCLAVAAIALTGSALAAGRRSAKPVTHTVTMDGTQFQPSSLIVHAGDTVVFVNKDPFPHTVMSDAGSFSSPIIQVGKSWTFTAAKAGAYPYTCTLHPTMKGTLTVK